MLEPLDEVTAPDVVEDVGVDAFWSLPQPDTTVPTTMLATAQAAAILASSMAFLPRRSTVGRLTLLRNADGNKGGTARGGPHIPAGRLRFAPMLAGAGDCARVGRNDEICGGARRTVRSLRGP
ncbi:hypothetical protein [Mycobacterium interjectum]|uniref:hypothetical protein n=1 Tax=Mycobacterium interjectum TaxID=33895 RepID=UPI001F26EC6E|nr:hypothetical protein [Mycobacterium interjectum]